jgi:arsenate reductase
MKMTSPETVKNVLFLCTGNSCRSQMGEGLVNHYLGHAWRAYSAGTKPAGYVHPLAVRAMAELGIDIGGARSKHPDELRDVRFDLVITVCDDAAEDCPLWLREGRVVHHAFYDPARAQGTDEERMAVFRRIRDEIKEWVLDFLSTDEPWVSASVSVR